MISIALYRRAVIVFIAMSLCASATRILLAQTPTWSITQRSAAVAEPFDNPVGAIELSDGRLILLDAGSFFVIDLLKGTRQQIGRIGDGPGEYRAPYRIFALPGDTVAYLDFARPRSIFFIVPPGEFRGGIASPVKLNPERVDRRGRFYSTQPRNGSAIIEDSANIVRWDPSKGTFDIIGLLRTLMDSRSLSLTQQKAGGITYAPPFASWDQWAVAQDATVAIVSIEPYQVIYLKPGNIIRGPPLPVDPVRLTDAHRREWTERALKPQLALISQNGGPLTLQRVPSTREQPDAWPAFLPPFLPGSVSFAPDGMLWVVRTTPKPSSAQIDVIDRRGTLSGRLLLPVGRRLLCHGRDSVYLLHVDEDGLQHLEQYRLPPAYARTASQ